MRFRRFNLLALLKATLRNWYAHNCLRLGASLSYYTLLSLFPLILVVLTIIRLLLNNSDAAREIIFNALASVTGGFRQDFETALAAARQTRGGSGIIGTVTLILGASWVFGEMVSAFNIIWGVQAPARGGPLQFLRSTFLSFALVFSGAFLLLVSMIISAVLAALGQWMQTLPGGATLGIIAHFSTNLLVLTLVFGLLFKFLPQTYVAWSDIWLGAVLTAIVWTLLQFAISSYIAFSNYANYGPVGAVLALVVWVYLSSQVLFLGGEFTAAFADRYGSRSERATLRRIAPPAEQPFRLQ
jgi:membrane protein